MMIPAWLQVGHGMAGWLLLWFLGRSVADKKRYMKCSFFVL